MKEFGFRNIEHSFKRHAHLQNMKIIIIAITMLIIMLIIMIMTTLSAGWVGAPHRPPLDARLATKASSPLKLTWLLIGGRGRRRKRRRRRRRRRRREKRR